MLTTEVEPTLKAENIRLGRFVLQLHLNELITPVLMLPRLEKSFIGSAGEVSLRFVKVKDGRMTIQGILKGGSIAVPLTSSLACLD